MSTDAIHITIYIELGAVICLCLAAALLLFLHTDGVRSRRILGWMMLVWGLIYVMQFISCYFNDNQLPSRGLLSVTGLTAGNLAIMVPMFYIIEIVRPGWLTGWRILLGFVPSVLLVVVYFGVLAILGQEPVLLESWAAFTGGLGAFNVWYRLLMLVASQVYVGTIMLLLVRYIPVYRRWADENQSSPETMDVGWIRNYIAGFLAMGIIFIILQLSNSWHRYLVYYPVIIGFFGYISYKGLFHRNAYPEGYFRDISFGSDTDDDTGDASDARDTDDAVRDAFSRQLDEYKAQFDAWMRTERPFLRPDFRRADVGELFPVNRTYLSRLFNEGYGMSFSRIVRMYRIEEAKRLLREHPNITPKLLSTLCGFSASGVFHRSFSEVTGMTVAEYRKSVMIILITFGFMNINYAECSCMI